VSRSGEDGEFVASHGPVWCGRQWALEVKIEVPEIELLKLRPESAPASIEPFGIGSGVRHQDTAFC
jgi:hypothetical protein